ncbi:hypothetical protein OWR29_11090 [Actinoplanes sp. Pm04-4]|uniref:Uncharacterized protein n=1 Tax=Paractinoplanes pyxinae TaxID=2997416 RepID=A0ABT4AWD4_9ACTN|nr:hypothetical protein [Actinoplanes pyxinae]MCY1138544.1 hypothetical protein [Actinoplanes pyxinae]
MSTLFDEPAAGRFGDYGGRFVPGPRVPTRDAHLDATRIAPALSGNKDMATVGAVA